MSKELNVFIQARMSSSRYPGKVLAPVQGVPLIKNLIDRVKSLQGVKDVVVLTSTQQSDDPLAVYLQSIETSVFRGDLENVFQRFQSALQVYSCDYCVRLCADSPFIETGLMQFMIDRALNEDYLLVSNVFSRKFPKGQSIEIIQSRVMLDTDSEKLSPYQQEHVMPYFYEHLAPERCLFYEINRNLGDVNQCIDTVDDLKSIDSYASYQFNPAEIQQVSVEKEKVFK